MISQTEPGERFAFKTSFLENGNFKYHVEKYLKSYFPTNVTSFKKEVGQVNPFSIK